MFMDGLNSLMRLFRLIWKHHGIPTILRKKGFWPFILESGMA